MDLVKLRKFIKCASTKYLLGDYRCRKLKSPSNSMLIGYSIGVDRKESLKEVK